MTGSLIAATLCAALLLVVVLAVVVGGWRLRVLSGRVGSFECAARAGTPSGGPWQAGIAHYASGRIDWWRSWSLAVRPARSWCRQDLDVLERMPVPRPGEPDLLLVRCRHHGERVELTMSAQAFAGLTAWLEAAPPTDASRVV